MNNYETKTCCEAETTAPRQSRNLTETMTVAKCMGAEALELANIIGSHLFGNSRQEGLSKTDGTCYRDVLEIHCGTLQELLVTLHDIAKCLGSLKE